MFAHPWLKLLRVEQYIKNGFVFLPLFFGGNIFHTAALWQTALMFFAFCAAASTVYIVNDILDKEEDKHHPTKQYRPIACGKISITHAIYAAVFLICIAATLAFYLSIQCFTIILIYLALNTFYVFYGKHRSIVDVACIATGFVLRTVGGGIASETYVSHWLILMVFLLCMFLALGKRWDDLCITKNGNTTGTVRKSLQNYTKNFILTSMTFLSTINTLCYILYTLSPQIIEQYNNEYLYITSVWVILGNLRYLQVTFVQENSASPTGIFLKDKGIQACLVLWFLHLFYLIYETSHNTLN